MSEILDDKKELEDAFVNKKNIPSLSSSSTLSPRCTYSDYISLSTTIVHSGYLYKKGGRIPILNIKPFKVLKYVRLIGSKLCIFEDVESNVCTRIAILNSGYIQIISNENFHFLVTSSSCTFELYSLNKEEYKNWLLHLFKLFSNYFLPFQTNIEYSFKDVVTIERHNQSEIFDAVVNSSILDLKSRSTNKTYNIRLADSVLYKVADGKYCLLRLNKKALNITCLKSVFYQLQRAICGATWFVEEPKEDQFIKPKKDKTRTETAARIRILTKIENWCEDKTIWKGGYRALLDEIFTPCNINNKTAYETDIDTLAINATEEIKRFEQSHTHEFYDDKHLSLAIGNVFVHEDEAREKADVNTDFEQMKKDSNILLAIMTCKYDIDYSPMIHSLCISLLHICTPNVAFVYLNSLLNRMRDPIYSKKDYVDFILFTPFLNVYSLITSYHIFSSFLKFKYPIVWKSLAELSAWNTDINPLFEWWCNMVLNLFIGSFPIETREKCFFLLLIEGEIAFYKIALCLIELCQSKLEGTNLFHIVQFLHGYCTRLYDSRHFFSLYYAIDDLVITQPVSKPPSSELVEFLDCVRIPIYCYFYPDKLNRMKEIYEDLEKELRINEQTIASNFKHYRSSASRGSSMDGQSSLYYDSSIDNSIMESSIMDGSISLAASSSIKLPPPIFVPSAIITNPNYFASEKSKLKPINTPVMSPICSSSDSASLYSPTQSSLPLMPSSPSINENDPYSMVLTKLYRQSSTYVCPHSEKTSSSAYYVFSFYSLRQLVKNDIFCDYILPINSDAILYKKFSDHTTVDSKLISTYLLPQQRLRFANALHQILPTSFQSLGFPKILAFSLLFEDLLAVSTPKIIYNIHQGQSMKAIFRAYDAILSVSAFKKVDQSPSFNNILLIQTTHNYFIGAFLSHALVPINIGSFGSYKCFVFSASPAKKYTVNSSSSTTNIHYISTNNNELKIGSGIGHAIYINSDLSRCSTNRGIYNSSSLIPSNRKISIYSEELDEPEDFEIADMVIIGLF